MDVAAAVAELEAELEARADPARAERERRYLKSALRHVGVPVPTLRWLAAAWRLRAQPTPDEVVALATALWARGVHEDRALACVLLEKTAKKLRIEHLPALEALLRASATWAYVDALATGPVAAIAARAPQAGATLDAWAADPAFWMRRAAMLALLPGLRAGGGDFERFTRYADAMLHEREFFVRKAIGWILRDTSRKRPALVRDWVAARRDRLSGLTLREATRRLPPGDLASLGLPPPPARRATGDGDAPPETP